MHRPQQQAQVQPPELLIVSFFDDSSKKKTDLSEVISSRGSSVVNAVGTAAARSEQCEAAELKSSAPLSSSGRTAPFHAELSTCNE